MIIKTKRKKSSRLETNPLIKKYLSIQFSLDGFSFCIYEKESRDYLAYSKYIFDDKINTPDKLLKAIQQIFKKDIELQYDFDNVLVLHNNDLVTFVPNAFFDKDHLSQYLKYNNKVLATDFFMYDTIKNQEMKAVYIPFININNFFIDRFGSFDYKHTSSIVVETLLNDYASKDLRIFVRLSTTFFKIIITKNRKLLFFNTFDFNTIEDFMYYVLFTCEQLKVELDKDTIYFLGETEKNKELIAWTKKYFNKVSLLQPKSLVNDASIDDTIVREDIELF